jgi:hypothetical protein
VQAVGLGYYIGGTGDSPSGITDSVAAPSGLASAERATPPAIAREPRAAKQVATRQEESRDRAAANARPDSIAAAAGVVAIGPQAALREATPAPVPSAALTTSRASADLDEARGQLAATEWPVIRPGPAREILGAAPVGIPGLAVRNIRRSPAGDVVLVEQALDSATVIQIFQQRMEDDLVRRQSYRSDAPRAAAPSRLAGTERLARFIGGVRVEIAGPLSVDSLNRLLEQLKAIP